MEGKWKIIDRDRDTHTNTRTRNSCAQGAVCLSGIVVGVYSSRDNDDDADDCDDDGGCWVGRSIGVAEATFPQQKLKEENAPLVHGIK